MIRQTLFLTVCIALFMVACKSDSKEPALTTTTDTTMVSTAVNEVSLDSMAVSEEDRKTPPSTSTTMTSKPSPSGKTPPADKSKSTPATGANAPSAGADAINPDEYLDFPSKKATYPGGQVALSKYLADNIKYPTRAREEGVVGTVYAYILVDELGKFVDVSFPKPLGSGLEEEVLRVIKAMPDLIPAEDNSVPVKAKYMLPVKFTLH